ncbi:helix-turn-helix domain-containing protein [Tenacibaculum maritimum]|uniref:helix-turn-helix domain-containing protein n=1 Tax=Tenacibaculum maritimum TaxID=107401 RepID=UPI0012E461AE|nr:transcriptional regulator [Tenacibaculum maritimum]CAA0153920.1 Transcriptional regulator [Tenacibaculum maritimum]
MDVDKKVCNYIAKEWVKPSKSNRNFALDHNIDEKTVRKILQVNGYRIPLRTLTKICEARNLKLEEFFKLVQV